MTRNWTYRTLIALTSLVVIAALAVVAIPEEETMFEIQTEIDIAADPATVWQILTDGERIDEWNPFIHELEGELAPGEQLSVSVGLGDSAMGFKPVVLVADESRELRWLGKLLVRGLLDGEHVFELHPTETGTHFVHYERFTGVLAPVLEGKLVRDTTPGFEAMNAALKQQAEAAAAPPAVAAAR